MTSENHQLSRGQFIKMGVAAIAAAVGGDRLYRHEQAKRAGFETSWATFIPRYERHTLAKVTPAEISADADLFCPEVEPAHHSTSYGRIVNLESSYTHTRVISDEVAQYLADNRIQLMYHDIDMPEKYLTTDEIGILLRSAVLTVLGLKDAHRAYHETTSTAAMLQTFGRRMALKFLLITPFIPDTFVSLVSAPATNTPSSNRRTSERITALFMHLQPEDALVNVRNLVWVVKFHAYAQEFHRLTGRKPIITYRFGDRHSNIEELLQLGPDFCMSVLRRLPQQFLKDLIELNGYDGFCASRVFQISDQIPFTEISSQNFDQYISDTALYDRRLEVLAQRFGLRRDENLRLHQTTQLPKPLP